MLKRAFFTMNDVDRVLLDTHALIWLAEGSLTGDTFELLSRIGRQNGLLISAVTGWELGLLAFPKRGPARIKLPPTIAEWFRRILSASAFKEVPLTARAAFSAATLPNWSHADPADRLLVAVARELDVPLVTRDREILAYAEAGHAKAIAC